MKGIVFAEFLDMVEEKHGAELVERVIESAELASNGAYTTVGTYDFRELIALVTGVSNATGTAPQQIVRDFGENLFKRFFALFPQFFENVPDAFTFLRNVESYIHVEVRKLYPDAELPSFTHRTVADGQLEMTYRSSRPFGDFAEGLIRGCIAHFKEPIDVARAREEHNENGTMIEFLLTRKSPVPA